MQAEEHKDEKEKDLANDVAHLYSLGLVGNIQYHSFSRRNRQVPHPSALTEVEQGIAETETPTASSQAAVLPATPEPEQIAPPVVAAEATSTEVPLQSLSGEPAVAVPSVALPWSGVSSALPEPEPSSQDQNTLAAIAIYSLAGGVGKTTITANIGRILSSLGEMVLLVDASGSGLLPFYFGASDLRPGLRTFIAPGGNCAPMRVFGTEEITSQWLESEVVPAMQLGQRTIFDLGAAATAVLPQILSMCSIVLVPLWSDLNSYLTVPRIEAAFKTMQSRGVNVPLPFYVFNKVDAHSLMDQEGRNLILRQCGDRLLPMSIRRSPDIPAAISDRMTVADHAPGSEVTHDLMKLARWLQEMAPAQEALRILGRWSER